MLGGSPQTLAGGGTRKAEPFLNQKKPAPDGNVKEATEHLCTSWIHLRQTIATSYQISEKTICLW